MSTEFRVRPRWLRPAAVLLALAFPLLTPREAGAQFIPYYGKNKVKYDNFAWRVYKSPHFEVFYYPEFEQHLGRLVSYLESAYLKISTGLKHEMSRPVPVIFYKTHSEFEETNLFPAFVPEGVAAFTEPVLNRMVLPIDEPPERLQGLITHELTHAFAFDLIPRGLGFGIAQRSLPLWVDEGLADYFRGIWDPLDLMMIRDAALTDNIPKLSRAEFEAFSGRLVYNLGHACFEFMESRYGKEGIRQFLYTLRKGILGGSLEDLFKQAFRTTPDEFDIAFDKWLKERFKPYRDKQRPDDFGRDLSPDPRKEGHYTQAFAFTPSPSGEIAAIVTGNIADGEADIILVSTRDGKVVKNLTPGFASAYEGITLNSEFVAGRSIAFDPRGDSVAFFGRTGKGRSLFLVSVLDGSVKKKMALPLDEPQAPALLPDGRHVVFAALKEGVADIWEADLDTKEIKNLTQDEYYDNNPVVSSDGKLVAYERDISGNRKIYAFPLADPSRKTQLTFGPFNDAAPDFSSDGKKLYYASDEDDDIFNLRSLDLQTGAIEQYTDVFGGTMAPAPIQGPQGDRLAFLTYFKGEYRLHTQDTKEPLKEVDQDVRPAAEGLVDFQPNVTHDVIPENKRRKHIFEGLYLEGRPPINVGVTSSGDFYGGTAVGLTDVLGDQLFTFQVLSVREFRQYDVRYINLAKRLHYGVDLFDGTYFFYASPYGLDPTGYGYYDITRNAAVATQRFTGAQIFAEYPLDKFRRLEISGGLIRVNEGFRNADAEQAVCGQAALLGVPCFINNGWQAPIGLSLVQETTRFAEFGPLAGSTFDVGVRFAPAIGSFLQRTTVDADLRKYLRLGSTTALLALRARGFRSTGDNPDYFYFGGNMELRGYPYYGFAGNEGFFANAEFRFPIIDLAATPLGLIGPIRGTFFAGVGGAKFRGESWRFSTSEPGFSYINDPIFGEPATGRRLLDARASFGFGLQLFFLGYPLHFDWTKFTDLAVTSDSWKFSFWMGYDF